MYPDPQPKSVRCHATAPRQVGHRTPLVLPIIAAGIIVVFSLAPDLLPSSDWVAWATHATAFAALVRLVLGWLSRARPTALTAWRVLGVVTAVVVFGFLVEVAQATVHRDPDVTDLLADSVGTVFGMAMWRRDAQKIRDATTRHARFGRNDGGRNIVRRLCRKRVRGDLLYNVDTERFAFPFGKGNGSAG